MNCVPMYTVEKSGFAVCLIYWNHDIPPALVQTLRPETYSKVMSCVLKLVDVVPYVSITTDLWSSQAMDSYISLTGH